MALINCPECNKEISDQAGICSSCGYPLPIPTKKLDTQAQADTILGCMTVAAVAVLIIFIIFVIVWYIRSKDNTPSDFNSLQKNQSSATCIYSTTDEFRIAFNDYSKNSKRPLFVGFGEKKYGEINDTQEYFITNNLSILLKLDKTSSCIKEIVMIGRGNGMPESGIDIVNCTLTIISLTTPNAVPDERRKIMSELGLWSRNKDWDINKKTTFNGMVYSFVLDKKLGVWLRASKLGND